MTASEEVRQGNNLDTNVRIIKQVSRFGRKNFSRIILYTKQNILAFKIAHFSWVTVTNFRKIGSFSF